MANISGNELAPLQSDADKAAKRTAILLGVGALLGLTTGGLLAVAFGSRPRLSIEEDELLAVGGMPGQPGVVLALEDDEIVTLDDGVANAIAEWVQRK